MKKKILILSHKDEPFLKEVMACLEGLDVEVHFETRCPVELGIKYDWEPDAVVLNSTMKNSDRCIRHIKSLSKKTVVLVAERDSNVERYIQMQVLGVRDYFHVPLDKKNMRNAVIDLLKIEAI
jgi:DNA-binding NtrC family response regulator